MCFIYIFIKTKKVVFLRLKNILSIFIIMAFVFPLINADVTIPTRTKVYLEQDGIEVDSQIEIEINGYGYSYPPGPKVFKEQGTYTPEKIKSIKINYTKPGEIIYDPYYMNYRHFDYWEIKGKTKTGQEFIIKDISKFSEIINCENNPVVEKKGKYYRYKDYKKVIACSEQDENSRSADLRKYCEDFYAVAGRCTFKTYNEIIGAPLDMDSEECKPFFVEVNKEEVTDDKNHSLERFCEIRIDLKSADWGNDVNPYYENKKETTLTEEPDNNNSVVVNPETNTNKTEKDTNQSNKIRSNHTENNNVQKRSIFRSIGCFFKGLFGKGC